jgi:membrane-associated phospholipid phosphatase
MNHKQIITLLLLIGIPLIVLCHFYIDIPVARWAIAHDALLYDTFKMLSNGADATYWLVGSGLLWLVWKFYKKNALRASQAAFLFLSVAFSGIGVNILKVIFGKARPKLLYDENFFGFTWFADTYNYFSFPSGHTTTAFAVATALSLMLPRYGIFFYMYAVLMALSRVLSWWHYPSDVIAGLLLGTIVTLILYNSKKISFKGQTNAP